MTHPRDIVITGTGVVSPIGIGKEAFWQSLEQGASGVRRLQSFDASRFPSPIGGELVDFDPKQYVTPRKSLKVMSREIQTGFAAARLAIDDAVLDPAKSTRTDSASFLGRKCSTAIWRKSPPVIVPVFRMVSFRWPSGEPAA
jgi:3-oxoacyl-(acyl-carrier-protein) synthase